MNAIDILVLVLFVPFLIKGWIQGFFKQVVSVLAVILGAWLAYSLASTVSNWLAPYVTGIGPGLLKGLCFFIIFVVVALLLKIVGSLLTRLMDALDINWFNRLLGDAQPGAVPITWAEPSFVEADDLIHPAGLLGPVEIVEFKLY